MAFNAACESMLAVDVVSGSAAVLGWFAPKSFADVGLVVRSERIVCAFARALKTPNAFARAMVAAQESAEAAAPDFNAILIEENQRVSASHAVVPRVRQRTSAEESELDVLSFLLTDLIVNAALVLPAS